VVKVAASIYYDVAGAYIAGGVPFMSQSPDLGRFPTIHMRMYDGVNAEQAYADRAQIDFEVDYEKGMKYLDSWDKVYTVSKCHVIERMILAPDKKRACWGAPGFSVVPDDPCPVELMKKLCAFLTTYSLECYRYGLSESAYAAMVKDRITKLTDTFGAAPLHVWLDALYLPNSGGTVGQPRPIGECLAMMNAVIAARTSDVTIVWWGENQHLAYDYSHGWRQAVKQLLGI
jgi:hypothetical protein